MTDYDLPELPSDEELGITNEDKEQLDDDFPEEHPELSKEEMVALLGEKFSPKKGGDAAGSSRKEKKAKRKREKEKAKAASAPAAPEGTRRRWRGPVTLALLIACGVYSSTRTGLPRPAPGSAPDTTFSSSRAMSMLIEIARRPHPTGSPEHERVRAYLVDRLRSLGYDPEVETAPSIVQVPGAARVATVRNVIARIPGTASTGAVLVTAHYDSRELAPGASDDGAGLVAILESLRALRARAPLRNDVIVLFTDAEELGMLGARAFVDRNPWMADVSVVLGFDMRGSAGPSIMFETNDRNGWIIRALDAFDTHPFANSMAYEVYRHMPNNTDFTPFKEAGKQGLNFAAIGNPHVYHQATDTPPRLSESTLQHAGMHALAALDYLGRTDLSSVDAPNVAYFTVPILGLVVYGRVWIYVITLGLLALAALTTLLARRSGARPRRVAVGFALSLVVGGLSFATGVGLTRWIARFHPEGGSLMGSLYHSEGWYMVALVGVVFAIVATAHAVARRWLSTLELSLGALVVPLLGAIVVTLTTPLAAMDLQWPVAAALVSCLVLAALGSRAGATVGWIATLLLALPVLVFMVPITELLWITMSIALAGGLAVLSALGLYLCLPALDALRHPNAVWAPVLGLAVAGIAIGMGTLAARPNAERPAPSTLIYVYERGTGSAMWATDANADSSTDAEAVAWATERAGSPFTRTVDLSRYGYPQEHAPATTAPVVNAAPPYVAVLEDSIQGPVRRVALGVRSEIGAEVLGFQIEPNSRTRLLSIDGLALASPDSLRWVEHWGVPDSLVVVDLEMPADDPIGLRVVEQLLRPGELVGPQAFARPPDLAPDVNAMSDRALLGYSVSAFADPRHAFVPTQGAVLPDSADAVEADSVGVGRPASSPDSRTDSGSAPAAPTPPDTAGAVADSAR